MLHDCSESVKFSTLKKIYDDTLRFILVAVLFVVLAVLWICDGHNLR